MPFVDPDWLGLWRELVDDSLRHADACAHAKAHPHRLAKARPDPLVDFVCRMLGPEQTAIDVGAATGRWTIPLASVARRVTAVDPSPEMVEQLRHNVAQAGLQNVTIVQSAWEQAQLEAHDAVVSSHSMYGASDFAALVRSLQRAARKYCFLAIRLTSFDGVMGELCRKVRGHSHDSANAVIGYNALLSMGIYPNVLVEPVVRHWQDESHEAALLRARRHLLLTDADTRWDGWIAETLDQRLVLADGVYHWPDWMRSALIWWKVENAPEPD